jgi:hypothetical protein
VRKRGENTDYDAGWDSGYEFGKQWMRHYYEPPQYKETTFYDVNGEKWDAIITARGVFRLMPLPPRPR